MWDSAAVVLPVFGLIGVGYGARALGAVSDRAGEGVSEFVFTLAVPCLIFRTLSRAELPAVQPWGYWISYFLGVAIVWAVAMALAIRVFRVTGNAAVVAGFTAGQSNTVFVGVPMILKAYGDEGAVPLFLLIAVHLPVVILAATLMVEGRSVAPATLVRRVLVNPIILAILVGSTARPVAGFLPDPLWRMVEMLGAAAIPCALIAMGIALHRYGFEAGWPVPALITVLKLGLHPLLVYLLATRVFSMPPAWVGVAVLFAACPSGVNAYLFAERYGEGVALASSAIALSTALGIVTTLLWLQLLGVS